MYRETHNHTLYIDVVSILKSQGRIIQMKIFRKLVLFHVNNSSTVWLPEAFIVRAHLLADKSRA